MSSDTEKEDQNAEKAPQARGDRRQAASDRRPRFAGPPGGGCGSIDRRDGGAAGEACHDGLHFSFSRTSARRRNWRKLIVTNWQPSIIFFTTAPFWGAQPRFSSGTSL